MAKAGKVGSRPNDVFDYWLPERYNKPIALSFFWHAYPFYEGHMHFVGRISRSTQNESPKFWYPVMPWSATLTDLRWWVQHPGILLPLSTRFRTCQRQKLGLWVLSRRIIEIIESLLGFVCITRVPVQTKHIQTLDIPRSPKAWCIAMFEPLCKTRLVDPCCQGWFRIAC